ncbi:MAG: TrmH family RNA methyltransferase [Acidimicrobiales bacterium]
MSRPLSPPPPGALTYRHQRVQRLRRLLGRPAARQEARAFVVEGVKLLDEALLAGAPVESVYAGPGAPEEILDRAEAAGVRVHLLAPGVVERVAATVNPQPVLAVVRAIDVPLSALSEAGLVLVCVDVRDPGNAGTVLRSAEAAGVEGIVCCGGAVDIYNPKTVRASAGSIFHVPVVAGPDAMEVLDEMAIWGIRRLGTTVGRGRPYTEVDLTMRSALVLGNEANGLPPQVLGALDEVVTIPMRGRTSSLNVGMAAAVLCFEAARQRTMGPVL